MSCSQHHNSRHVNNLKYIYEEKRRYTSFWFLDFYWVDKIFFICHFPFTGLLFLFLLIVTLKFLTFVHHLTKSKILSVFTLLAAAQQLRIITELSHFPHGVCLGLQFHLVFNLLLPWTLFLQCPHASHLHPLQVFT